MKLFDENYRLTAKANQITNHTHGLIKPYFDQLVKQGYSPREVSLLMQQEINIIEMESIL